MNSTSVAPNKTVDGFDTEFVLNGPGQYLFTLEDVLQIDSKCSLANIVVTIKGVMLTGDFQLRPFTFTHAPNSNSTLATTRQHIGSGWLQHVRAFVSSGTPLVGQCFVWIRMARGLTVNAETHGTITSGYVTANKDIFFPGSQPTNPLDEEGAPRSIQQANPAVGTDFAITVPANIRWEIAALSAQLVAANAGTPRSARFIIDDGANVLFELPAVATQAINTTTTYSIGQGAGGPVVADALVLEGPAPNDLYLPAGFRIRSSTGGLNAADQWQSIFLLAREWQEGN